MSSLLVVIEHDRGTPAPSSWEAMTAGRAWASRLGAPLEAVMIGDGADPGPAAGYGATKIHLAQHPLLSDYGPEAWGETVRQLAAATGAVAVLAAGTDRGNEVLAQTAARLDRPLAVNVVEAYPGDPWELTRVQWGGSLLERVSLDEGVKLMTLLPHAVEAVPADSPAALVTEVFVPELDPSLERTVVRDRVVLTQGVTLATARVVVSGGRGVGSAEGFAKLEELAELLGGVVGCSRVVTNNGWRPHTDQVGQTGTRIAPTIYIACGISGAIQHWVGAMASKHILAINTDREANMVVKADYAVIGDLHQILPAIIEQVRAAQTRA